MKVFVLMIFLISGAKEQTRYDVDTGVFKTQELCETVKGMLEPDLKKEYKVVQMVCVERVVYERPTQ